MRTHEAIDTCDVSQINATNESRTVNFKRIVDVQISDLYRRQLTNKL